MGTDPSHQKRGAATKMIQWGLERCKQEGIPAYLESTMEAVPLYTKNGFVAASEIFLAIDENNTYEEAACIYQPEINSSTSSE